MPSSRAYGNNWHDQVMGIIELGSEDAFVAMAHSTQLSDAFNLRYDHGMSSMHLWWIFECDDRAEAGLPPTNYTPWGPYKEAVNG